MIDGAIMNIASTQANESQSSLGLRHQKAPSMKKGKDLGSNEKDDSFQKNLRSKLDQRDRHSDNAPQKKASSSPEKAPQSSANERTNNERPVQSSSQRPERQQSVHPPKVENTRVSQKPLQEEVTRPEVNVEAMENSLLLWNQAQENSPVLKFMDSMESEFGVEPERLIEAFGGLTDAQLMQSPEDSMESYLKQLSIPEDQMGNAKDMYQKLLTDMRFKKVGQQDNTKLIPMELQSALSEMTELKEPMALEKQGIANLNKRFFDVYPNQFGRPLQDEKPMAVDMQARSFMPNAEGKFDEIMSEGMIPKQTNPLEKAPVSTQDALWANAIQHPAQQQTAANENSNLFPGMAMGAAAGLADASTNVEAPDAEVPEWLSKLSNGSLDANQDSSELSRNDSSAFSDEGSSQGENLDGQNSSNLMGDGNASKTQNEKFAKILATGGAAEAGKADAEPEGVESIVKNVQLLSKKGGGEMKVQLNQEGLGEMQLKVAVNEGKVNIQMITDNKDTKKLIEGDLSALKMELGEKKIDLSEIKVDVAKDMKNQLDQQMADQKREETRQFWQQFRQENEAKRAMSMNMGLNSYQAKDPNSIEDRGPSASSYRSSNLSSKLDIVA